MCVCVCVCVKERERGREGEREREGGEVRGEREREREREREFNILTGGSHDFACLFVPLLPTLHKFTHTLCHNLHVHVQLLEPRSCTTGFVKPFSYCCALWYPPI